MNGALHTRRDGITRGGRFRRRTAVGNASALIAVVTLIAALWPGYSATWDRGAHPAAAAAGWTWYKTDTHVHSVVSGDALSDIGIISQQGKSGGYNAYFLTDHNAGSNFRISTFIANHIRFDDAYDRWQPATYGSLSAETNAVVSSPTYNGSAGALHVMARSGSFGESYIYEKRGPNFRSGDIILQVAIYPTRIDLGAGVYVSAAIGGDPTIPSDQPNHEGYTTQAGVISPGKSTVLVWQLGTPRAPSSDPNQRVLTYDLGAHRTDGGSGPYTLNQWNTYVVNVSEALNDIPPADRPLDYNALTFLKMAAAGAGGGTADAYFDAYQLDATLGDQTAGANEYVYRTSVIDDFDTSTFKIFPSYEMGMQQHSQRFNFGITDPSQYVAYQYGVDGIGPTQNTGYPAMLNHPGVPGGVAPGLATANQGYGADIMEVREENMLQEWDGILNQGVQIIGSWSSDAHSAESLSTSKPATFIYAPALEFDLLIRSFYEGRAYNARGDFAGRLIFNLDGASSEPYPARYPVYVPDGEQSAAVHLGVTGGLSSGYTIRWISNGAVIATDGVSGSAYEATKTIPLTGSWTYVRAEVRSSTGSVRATTQPIFFRAVSGLPSDLRYQVDGITTATGTQYTKTMTKGIVKSTWDGTLGSLTLDLADPAGALVWMTFDGATVPQQVKVDGAVVTPAASLADFDGATGSSWYADATNQRLYLKALHAGGSARLRIDFGPGSSDTTPPTAPASLAAAVGSEGQVDLTWEAATDDIGVTGYDVYRDGALLESIGAATSYTDATAAPSSAHSYDVEGLDAAGNISPPSNTADVTTPVFADGFEGGSMAQWTSSTNLQVQQEEIASGVYAVRGTSTGGSVTYARKTLSTAQSELFYRVKFKLLSKDATTLYMMRFRTGADASLLGVYISSTGRIGYRNDVAASSITSSTIVTTGTWHELQVRVRINGTASETEVWYDGARVDTLSRTESLGTTPVGIVQLGESTSGKTYNIAFDDVTVDTVCVTACLPIPTPTPTPTPTPAGGVLFADGFESGDLASWTANSGLVAQQELVYAGAWAARGTSTGSATYARETLSASQTDLYYQIRFNVVSQGASTVYLLRFRTGANGSLLGLYVTGSGKLGYRNDVAAVSRTSSTVVTQGAWHEAQVHVRIDGAASQTEVWYDGARVDALSLTEDLGTEPVGILQLGENSSGKSYDVAFDEIAADTSFIGSGLPPEPTPTPEPTATATPEPTPTATPIGGYVFADDFEVGDLGRWTANSGLVAQQDVVYGGAWAARGTSSGGDATYARAAISDQTDLHYRLRFNLLSQGGDTVYLLRFRTAGNGSLLGLYITSSGKLGYRNDAAGQSTTSNVVVSQGIWHEVEVRVLVDGASGQVEVWLDGVRVDVLGNTENLGTDPIGILQLGENSAGKTYDVAFDDVAADTICVDACPPAAPTPTPTDTPTETPPPTPSPTPTSTLSPTASPTPAGGVLFADGFESGDFAAWTANSGLVVQQEHVRAGAYAARGTAAGNGSPATYASWSLGSDQAELYYRVWFKVVGQGADTVYLLRFRTASNASLVGIYISSTGKLGLRNDVTPKSTTSSTVVTAGVWHELQARVRINGTASETEVWYDGGRIDPLSGPVSLRTTGIGRIQLGENSAGKSYDVAFDEVAVDTACIGSCPPAGSQAAPTPTPQPTNTPIAAPTATPTSTPTPEPTATPTPEPTATPTPEPTATPTPEPTATPTPEPSATPTLEPTATATG